ncbi:MAG: VTT domain-containing protein [Candidatus Moraniibacteriota bacterium]
MSSHEFFIHTEAFFRLFLSVVPLEWFVFIGSALEEFFSILPASLVMGIAGSAALIDGRTLGYLAFLAFFGNIGRLLGTGFYYWLGDKLEDVLLPRLTRIFGIGHKEVESIGKRFSGNYLRDGGLLFLMRLTPFFPVTLTSIACGIIKLDWRVYLSASFAGNFFKDFGYLLLGYAGIASLAQISHTIVDYKPYADIASAVAVVVFLALLYFGRGAGRKVWRRLKHHFAQ